MKAKLEIELKPFAVPNFVLVERTQSAIEHGVEEPSTLHLSELDADTLDRLCYEFRVAVFQKAGKRLPPTAI